MPLFSVVNDKLDRVARELDRLEDYLRQAMTDLENYLSSPA